MSTQIVIPQTGQAEHAVLVRWLKNEGQTVKEGEPIAEIETEKALSELTAPASGILSKVTAKPGDEVNIGAVLGQILSPEEHQKMAKAPAAAPPAATKELAQKPVAPIAPPKSAAPSGQPRVIAIAGMRRTISERLQNTWQTAPHITLTISIDMTQPQQLVQSAGKGKLGLTAVIAQSTATALLQHPRLNAHLRGNEIHEFPVVHLGIAVALDDGLVVPVIRNAEQKSPATIHAEVAELANRARAGRLQAHEIEGSTFTISNLGMHGIEQFTSILNAPEVAILSVGTIRQLPVAVEGRIVVRPMMQVAINTDHRAVDGVAAARFLATFKQVVEAAQA